MKKWTALLLCCALLMIPAATRAETGAQTETGTLSFELPEDRVQYEYRLRDDLVTTRISFDSMETFSLLPGEAAQAVVLSWYTAPESYVVSQLDEIGVPVGETSVTDGFVNKFIEVDSACARIVVSAESDCALAGAKAYAADEEIPQDVQRWEPSHERADLMLITAEPGAEWKQHGAVLPEYTLGRGIQTVVVYLSDYGKRARVDEALAALWAAGVRQYPVFAGFTCGNYDSADIVEKAWGKSATVKYITNLFETFLPKVVVTDGLNDASGAHRFTAECVIKAAEGSDIVEKLYTFGETGEAGAAIVAMNVPLNALDGETAEQTAQAAFVRHVSQQVFGKAVDASGKYTLQYTNVGEDEAKNDLFEHIDTAALLTYAPVTPSPAPTPTSSPTAEPTPTSGPAAEPTAQTSGAAEQDGVDAGGSIFGRFGASALILAAGIALSLLITLLLYRKIRRVRGKGDAACICILPLVAALAACAVLAGIRDGAVEKQTRQESGQAAMTASAAEGTPSPSPDKMPEETPMLTPEPEPTPAPEPEQESWYRKEDEPEEVVEIDAENGRWAYRSDTLGVEITRVSITNEDGNPVTYFVADIHIKDIYQFRPGFGSEGHTGRGATYPWIIARRANAVLWITGDNLINSEKEEKGILIRDGKIYSYENAEDTLVMYPDMSMRIFDKWETRANILLEDGVENSFSFGPTLIKDGVINENAKYHRIRRSNPRAGIGYFEPGHYLAVVVDGRQKDYSVGMTVWEFADLFAEYGCSLAYNLDGGLSAAMVFMGEQLNSHSGQRIGESNDISYQRAVPDGLMFGYSELVPGEDEPVYNDGNLDK
jgi:hypothetical protein